MGKCLSLIFPLAKNVAFDGHLRIPDYTADGTFSLLLRHMDVSSTHVHHIGSAAAFSQRRFTPLSVSRVSLRRAKLCSRTKLE